MAKTKKEATSQEAQAPKQKTREEKVLELTQELQKHITPYLKAGQASAAGRLKKACGTLLQYFRTFKP